MKRCRCTWANHSELEKVYHDKEWGVPQHNDIVLFEFLLLEGAQAGLSWLTILKKRENYRQAFDNFDWQKIANYNDKKIKELLNNVEIIRNKLKIKSAINNARQFQKIVDEFGSFNQYIWSFTQFKTIENNWKNHEDIPLKTTLSDTISKDLKLRGFTFVGSIIIYSYLQATGIVNDHLMDCFRKQEISHNKQ